MQLDHGLFDALKVGGDSIFHIGLPGLYQNTK